MAKDYRKELSFQAGELSPLFYGRSETEFYDKGLATARNVFIEKRGGAFRRNGLEHSGQLDGNDARVFTKQINRFRYDTIIIRDKEMVVIAPGAGFLTPNLVSNPNFLEGGTDWTVNAIPVGESTVTFANGSCFLRPSTNAPELVTEPNFESGGAGWNVRESNPASTVVFSNNQCVMTPRQAGAPESEWAGIWQDVTTNAAGDLHTLFLVGTLNTGINVKIGTGGEDSGDILDVNVTDLSVPLSFTPPGGLFTITINSYNPNVSATLDSVSIPEPTSTLAGISQEITVTAATTDQHIVRVTQAGNEPITIKVGTTVNGNEIAETVGGTEETDLLFVPNNATFWVTVETSGANTEEAVITFVGSVAEADSGGLGILMPAPWDEDQLQEIHLIEEPGGETMYFTHPNVRPQKLQYDFQSDVYAQLTDVVFVSIPPTWGFADNWPATGAYFQGRMWYGGTPEEPQTIWASKSASPDDFTTGALDDDSLVFTLQKFGRIQWMLGTKNLLIGTENGEHIVTSESGVVTPSDVSIRQQSAYGSNAMQSIQVGEKVFYATPDGRRLQSMSYEWRENNWLSQDLTFASEHLTFGTIRQRAWAQNPGALFFAVLENGDVACLTYDRTSETVGWTLFDFEDFTVFDVAVGLINGDSRLVLVGQRAAGTSKMTPGKIDVEITGGLRYYMDSFATDFLDPAANVLTGLDHLEGSVVQVVVDGAVEPPKLVSGGQITTERAGNRITAGVQIKSKIVTLPPDVDQGSIRSWKKRWNKVWSLMAQSLPPIINGVRPPDRTPSTPMDTAEPAANTHYKTVNLGWDDFGQITIEEDQPVSSNLIAIYGEMGRETL